MSKYKIKDYMIVNQESKPSKEHYIREILDFPSAEFELSELSKQQKLEIIEYFGLDTLTDLLDAAFQKAVKPYDAKIEAQKAYEYLTK